MRLPAALLIAFGLSLTPETSAQSYEAVSIKPSSGNEKTAFQFLSSGRIQVRGNSLKSLIRFSYDVRDAQISGGPPWLDSTLYDIDGTLDRPLTPTAQNRDRFREFLKPLLADRFHLVMHEEMREIPVYALVVAKSGVKMKSDAAVLPTDGRLHGKTGALTAEKLRLTVLGDVLSNSLGRPVVDQTGLTGTYTFQLDWTPDTADPDEPGPSLFRAVEEQLGLKLEPRKSRVATLIIDRAEKASEN